MKFYFFFLLSLFAFTSCKNEQQQSNAELTNKAISGNLLENAQGMIPLENKIYSILHHADRYTWKDLDQLYRNEMKLPTGDAYSGNLRKMAVIHLVNHFGLLEQADVATIEYYLNEQLEMDLIEPTVFMKTLARMKGVWSDDKIKQTIHKKHEDSMAFIKTSLQEPDVYLARHAGEFEQMKRFAQTLQYP